MSKKKKIKSLLSLIVVICLLIGLIGGIPVQAGTHSYEAGFSEGEEAVTTLPDGWKFHPNYRGGTLTQKDGALYFNTKGVSGIKAVFYDQSMYTDYLIEADYTMLAKDSNAKWMGILYRANTGENALNMFSVKWDGLSFLHAYYGTTVTNYDKTTSRSHATYGTKSVGTSTTQKKVNLKLAVIGNKVIAFVNDVKAVEWEIKNVTQELGSFGIVTSGANIKVENYKVTDLSELNQENIGDVIEHGLSLPSTSTTEITSSVALGNYIASSTLGFDASADENASAKVIIAESVNSKVYATITKGGVITVTKETSEGSTVLMENTVAISNTEEFVLRTVYANGTVKLQMDGKDIGYACALEFLSGKYGFASDGTATLKAVQLNETVKSVSSSTLKADLPEIEYNTTPNWNKVELECTMSDGSVVRPNVTADMISGFDPTVSGEQTVTLTYECEGKTYTESFTVTVGENPKSVYSYDAEFSESEEGVTTLPEGWRFHPNYSGGTLTQKDGALYFNTKGVSGLKAVFYEQSMYTDYLIEADYTMLDKDSSAKWMGILYRANTGENALNMFSVKWDGASFLHAYYGTALTAYDGSAINKGHATYGSKTVGTSTTQTKVNLKLAVIGNKVIAFVNDVKAVEWETNNVTQELGSFGIVTSGANIKVENYKVINLSELNEKEVGKLIEHGLTLPTNGAVNITSSAVLGNHVASSTLGFDASADENASVDVLIAQSGGTKVYATIEKNGKVTVTKETSKGSTVLMEKTATIANTAEFVLKAVYVNGTVKLSIDNTDVGYALALKDLIGKYGFVSDGAAVLKSVQLNETVKSLSAITINVGLEAIEYNTTPDWSAVEIICTLSDGSVVCPEVTDDMISGLDTTETGPQHVTLTYNYNGETFTKTFKVIVKDDPNNIPKAKIGVMSDVHIGAVASNKTALINALNYYKEREVDAIVVVGDFCHNYMYMMDEFNTLYKSVFPDGEDTPEKIFVMGNHDTYAFEDEGYKRGTEAHNEAVEEYFTNTFGCTADGGTVGLNYYKIVKGYVFVGLYVQTPLEEQEAILKEAFMLPEAQNSPVFVLHHEQPGGSTYCAYGYKVGELLKEYPNAVVFSGDNHNPLADERAIWQGEYTVVTTGALFGPALDDGVKYEGGAEGGIFQPGWNSAKAALYMEIYDSELKFVRYDFTHNEKLGKDWVINLTEKGVDRSTYTYASRTEAAVAPEFAKDAEATATALGESVIKVTWPKAITVYEEMDDIIQRYIIRAYDADTNELVYTKNVISQYYLGRNLEYDSYSVTFYGLNSNTDYRFEVVAVESFQKESQPLVVYADTKEFARDISQAAFYANFDYDWDALEFDTYNHIEENQITFADGMLSTHSGNASKAIVKDVIFKSGTIETLISMNNTGANISAGIYLNVSNPDDEQDTITAYNVQLESAADSKGLKVCLYKFNGKYAGCLTYTNLSNYFENGTEKDSVILKAEIWNNTLIVSVDGKAVLNYAIGSVSGAVGLRSHYSGVNFEHIRIVEDSTEYVAPDTTEFDQLIEEAKELLANAEVGEADEYGCQETYISQEAYDALADLVEAYDIDLIRAYERHLVQVIPILKEGIEEFQVADENGEVHVWENGVCKNCGCSESEVSKPEITKKVYLFDTLLDSLGFDFYHSSNGGFAIKDGKLVPNGEEGEFKAVLRGDNRAYKSVSVDIYPVDGAIDAGLYIGASDAGHAADKINALAVLVQSDFEGWEDAANRIDIIVGEFPTWKEISRTVSETGNNNALFTNGEKEPLNLKVDIDGNILTITLSLISDPSKSVEVVYEYTGDVDLDNGAVGIRSRFDNSQFDNFAVEYVSNAVNGNNSNNNNESSNNNGEGSAVDTGDSSNYIVYMIVAFIGIALFAFGIMMKRKREN